MNPPFSVPPIVTYIVTALATVVGLFVSQGLIDNGTEKLITGIAAVIIPLGWLAYTSVVHHGAAKIAAAKALAGNPTASVKL